jgi:hypothetical protein
MQLNIVRAFLIAFVGLSLAGCGPAIHTGSDTALDGVDLVSMTDDMAMQITASPAVQRQIAAKGKLKIVVLPVENDLVGEVLPAGPAEAFTGRLRALLSKQAHDDFTWIMNRDAFNDLRRQELDYDLGPSPDELNPEYALLAKFSSLTDEDENHRSEYYLCVYELTNLQDRTVLWTGKYEVKKTAVKGFLD